ncbi:MAG: hypothetical protein F6K28_42115 [Microcoleus sp. SIO2G3]|nr:hypothetical protein [Microcoleus sp. SIO2G3]
MHKSANQTQLEVNAACKQMDSACKVASSIAATSKAWIALVLMARIALHKMTAAAQFVTASVLYPLSIGLIVRCIVGVA